MRIPAVLALGLALAACSASAQSPAGGAGETARPVMLRDGAPVPVRDAAMPPRSATVLATPGPGPNRGLPLHVDVGDGTAYVTDNDRLSAIDLATGRTRWAIRVAHAYGDALPAGRFVVVRGADGGDRPSTIVLRAANGSRAYVVRDALPACVLDGVLYAMRDRSFGAYELATGRRIWTTLGAQGAPVGTPVIAGNVLLQHFVGSGATIVTDLYGFDVRTGHARWRRRSNPELLGRDSSHVYVNSTWFPMQLDNYVPLTVGRLDTATGAGLDELTYRPDPDVNAHTPSGPARATSARVAGGFVYLLVRGTWYRYAADTAPANAQPTRLDGIDAILGWQANGTLVVVAHGALALARDANGALVLQRIAPASGYSSPFRRADGTLYVVDDGALLAVAPDAAAVRRLGAVPCGGDVTQIAAADSDVVVVCDTRTGPVRLLAFHDPVAPPTPAGRAARPRPAPAARFTPAVHLFAVPPSPNAFGHQWWMHAIAPLPSGGVAFTLGSLNGNEPGAIGRASANGAIDVTALPITDHPIAPGDLVVDRHGVVWFNDVGSGLAGSLDDHGHVRFVVPGEPQTAAPVDATPPPQRPGRPRFRRNRPGVRLAIGPDGEAWFARSNPTPVIGRIDGSATFTIPPDAGEVVLLRGARDGFWYASRSAIGRVSTGGRFTTVPVPRPSPHQAVPVIATAPDGSAWIADGAAIVHVGANGSVLTRTTLPNATLAVSAAVVGCDGALYAAENEPLVARVGRDGRIDEVPVDVFGLDGITAGRDCRLWFAAGSNASRQQIGTLELRTSPR